MPVRAYSRWSTSSRGVDRPIAGFVTLCTIGYPPYVTWGRKVDRRTALMTAASMALLAGCSPNTQREDQSVVSPDAPPAHEGVGAALGATDTGVGCLAIRTNESAAVSDVVILQSWESAQCLAIKKSRPSARVLVYCNVSNSSTAAVQTDPAGTRVDAEHLPNALGYVDITAHHPEWLLHDKDGAVIRWRDFPYVAAVDVGDAGYQRAAADAIASRVALGGWDGVFMDDLLVSESHDSVSGNPPVDLTGGARRTATESFLTSVAPRLRRAGIEVAGNITSSGPGSATAAISWAPLLDDVAIEYAVKWAITASGDLITDGAWRDRLKVMRDIQEAGAAILPITYGSAGDLRLQRFHRGTYLLGWDGHSASASMFVPSMKGVEASPEDASAWLGIPLAPAYELGSGGYGRHFAGGQLVVNPTTEPISTTVSSATLTERTVQLPSTDARFLSNNG